MKVISGKQLDDLADKHNWRQWSMGLLENNGTYFFDFDTNRQYLELQFSTFSMFTEWLNSICGEVSPERVYEDMLE